MGKVSGLTALAVGHAETSLLIQTEVQKYSRSQTRRRKSFILAAEEVKVEPNLDVDGASANMVINTATL
jgi:hypothetical protein